MENMRATDALNAMDFSDLEAQIERLKQKELIIKNETAAKKTLVKASYYSLINGYKKPFLSNFSTEEPKPPEKFLPNVHFEDIHNLYKFDAKLRQIVLTIALAIEEDLASILAHIVSDTYCNPAKPETFRSKDDGLPLSYFNKRTLNIRKEKRWERTKLLNDVTTLLTNPSADPIKYYVDHQLDIPPWVLVKGLSFGNFISWYNLSKGRVKQRIVGTFLRVAPQRVTEEQKANVYYALKLIQLFRNVAAHGGRIYNFEAAHVQFPYMEKYHLRLFGITKAEHAQGRGASDFLAFILAIFYLNVPEQADDGYEESYSNDCVYEFMTDLKQAFGHYVMNNIEWVPLVLKEMHFKIEYLNKLERMELS